MSIYRNKKIKIKLGIVAVLFFALFADSASALTIPTFRVLYNSARRIVAPQVSNHSISNPIIKDFLFYSTATSTVNSGSQSGTVEESDILYDYYSTASVTQSCQLHFEDGVSNFESTYPSVATVDASGNVTHVADGVAQFTATKDGRKKSTTCIMSSTVSSYSQSQSGFSASSLARDIYDAVNDLIDGLTPSSTTYNIYSSVNDSTKSYTRNTSLFANSIDLTAIPVYSSSYDTRFNGVLVAPDILIQANHMKSTGTIYFVDDSNVTTSRTITGGTAISGTDIYVAKLNSPVASGINPMPVLTSDVVPSKITTNAMFSAFKIPVLHTNRFRTLKIGSMSGSYTQTFYVSTPFANSSFYSWHTTPSSGDSGSPAFVVIDGQPVLVGTWYTKYAVSNVKNYISEINSAITSLGSANSLTTVDLSSFPSY